ncbi:hypothetical protein WQE_51105 [Paraburkholderia hospita]|uniref:Aminomethyltransferase folate-binding domain-containing protein n=1 Tax=Paraburkholderia hospita TaxID=169430 RepID=A0ABN0F3J1_9BURK|nr:hypothetical protein [Paraburkholderia hospita]EIM93131.1 hypothetical protein WQE_51105 [Paraburkholderia hospita]OUL80927.1 hypothetical protein CA602_26570 [Paraburkholderia hospita]
MQHTYEGLLPIGGLRLARDLGIQQGLKGRVPADMPLLACPMDQIDFMAIGTKNASACFGFGKMNVDDFDILTIRLQHDGTQIYWLADMTDPELWRAIDMWLKHKFVPHAFEVDNGLGRDATIAFGKAEISNEAPIINKFRGRTSTHSLAEGWDKMMELAGSGLVQLQATTDIPGVPLTRVFVNLLVTKRYKRFLHGKLMHRKPLLATAGSMGASNFH